MLEAFVSSKCRLMWRYPEYQRQTTTSHPCTYLPLSDGGGGGEGVNSDLYRLSNKLSRSRWLAGCSSQYRTAYPSSQEIFKICEDMFTALSYLAAWC